MTVRIAIDDLPLEVRRAIERGDAVELERGGQVIGRLEPGSPGTAGWEQFLMPRRLSPPLDHDAFLDDLEQVREELNRAASPGPWEP